MSKRFWRIQQSGLRESSAASFLGLRFERQSHPRNGESAAPNECNRLQRRCKDEINDQTDSRAVDLEVGAAYVKYAAGPSVSTIDLDGDGSVAYEVNGTGVIMGIEVLGIDVPEQIAIAQKFAAEHDLAFPRDFAGTLAA